MPHSMPNGLLMQNDAPTQMKLFIINSVQHATFKLVKQLVKYFSNCIKQKTIEVLITI